MSSFYTYTMTETDLTKISNQAKEILLLALVGNKYLTKDEANEIKNNYAIVISKKGWLGSAWDKFRGVTEDEGMQINVVKSAIPPDAFNDEEDEPTEEE